MPAQERNDPGWARPCGEERRCYRHDDERDEKQTTDKWVLVGQEHRHPDDGPEFARRPHSDDVRPEIRREHPGIAENRQESPEGGGGEREAHDEGVDGQTGRDEGDAQGQRQASDSNQVEALALVKLGRHHARGQDLHGDRAFELGRQGLYIATRWARSSRTTHAGHRDGRSGAVDAASTGHWRIRPSPRASLPGNVARVRRRRGDRP